MAERNRRDTVQLRRVLIRREHERGCAGRPAVRSDVPEVTTAHDFVDGDALLIRLEA